MERETDRQKDRLHSLVLQNFCWMPRLSNFLLYYSPFPTSTIDWNVCTVTYLLLFHLLPLLFLIHRRLRCLSNLCFPIVISTSLLFPIDPTQNDRSSSIRRFNVYLIRLYASKCLAWEENTEVCNMALWWWREIPRVGQWSLFLFVAVMAAEDDSLLVLASILNWEAHPNNKHLGGIVWIGADNERLRGGCFDVNHQRAINEHGN